MDGMRKLRVHLAGEEGRAGALPGVSAELREERCKCDERSLMIMDDEKWNKCPVCGLKAFAPRDGNRVTCRFCRTVFTLDNPLDRKRREYELMRYRPNARHKVSGPGR